MLSPPDIDQLLQFALAQGNYGSPSNAYVGMIAPNDIHYVILFNGNYNDALVTFSQQQLDNFSTLLQWRNYAMLNNTQYSSDGKSLNSNGLERLFFRTLKDMGLDEKINLQRIENNGIIKTINKNTDGTTTTAIPGP